MERSPKAVFHINAQTVKAEEVVKQLRQHATLITESAAAKAKWLKAVGVLSRARSRRPQQQRS